MRQERMRLHDGQQLKQDVKHFQASPHSCFASTVFCFNILKLFPNFWSSCSELLETGHGTQVFIHSRPDSYFLVLHLVQFKPRLCDAPDPRNCQLFWLLYVLGRIDWRIAKTNIFQICSRLQWTSAPAHSSTSLWRNHPRWSKSSRTATWSSWVLLIGTKRWSLPNIHSTATVFTDVLLI